MKRLYISSGIIILIFLVTLFNSLRLQTVCQKTASLLNERNKQITTEQAEEAERYWQAHMLWFDMVLNNAEIDHVDEEFQMLKDMIGADDTDTILAQRNKLTQLIDEVWKTEALTLGNVL